MEHIIITSYIPEIFLSVCILTQLLCNTAVITKPTNNYPLLHKELFIQLYFILFIVLILLFKVKIEGVFSNGLFINDFAANQIKIIFILSMLLISNCIWQGYVFQNLNFFEFFTLFFVAILASMLLVSAYDLLPMYLLLELQALSFYILAGFKRNSTFSTEASLKYFITGSFFSCVLLLGIFLIYAALGTTSYSIIRIFTISGFPESLAHISALVSLGFFLIIIVFLFKLAVVPFHFWAPDVYDGAPISTTIIFSALPKIILVTVLIRLLVHIPLNSTLSHIIFFGTGILSIVWGTLNALIQKRVKKLYIFSSITQIGFIALALGVFTQDSIAAIYFFLIIYNITSAISWSALVAIYIFKKQELFDNNEKKFAVYLSDLSNLFQSNPSWAIVFIFIFFSMAGIPPFVGFLSKFYVFLSIFEAKYYLVGFFTLLLTSFSVFYYIRVLKIVFFEPNPLRKENTLFEGSFNFLFKDFFYSNIVFASFLLVFFFFNPSLLLLISQYISIGLLGS